MRTNRTPLGFGAPILPPAACRIARGLPLERRGDPWRFGDQWLSIQLHAGTGAFAGIDLDGEPAARDAGAVQYFDIRTSNRGLTGSGIAPRRIQIHRTAEREIAATVRTGDWTAEFHSALHPESARIRRWVRIVWHGPGGQTGKTPRLLSVRFASDADPVRSRVHHCPRSAGVQDGMRGVARGRASRQPGVLRLADRRARPRCIQVPARGPHHCGGSRARSLPAGVAKP